MTDAIGPDYQAKAMASVIGPSHSTLIPETLWGVWLDADDEIIGETGIIVPHAAFQESEFGVINNATIEAGSPPEDAVAYALADAETGGVVIAIAEATVTLTPDEPAVFPVATLEFRFGTAP